MSPDTYPYNFSNPVELNRYVYTANNPINSVDPTGQFALSEYAISLAKKGAAIGALYGVGQSLACGGNLIGNVLFGALAGAGFGVAYAYVPGLALGGGVLLGTQSALSAVQNAEVNGPNTCNGFTAVTSMLMVAFSAVGLVSNSNLRSLSNFSYSEEMLNPSMGHEGYYSDTGPIRGSTGTPLNQSLLARLMSLKDTTALWENCADFVNRYLISIGRDALSPMPNKAESMLGQDWYQLALSDKFIRISDIFQAKPGDILTWNTRPVNAQIPYDYYYHTGIYLGDGLFISKLGPGKPIEIMSVFDARLLGTLKIWR